jgi:hypothetical protein
MQLHHVHMLETHFCGPIACQTIMHVTFYIQSMSAPTNSCKPLETSAMVQTTSDIFHIVSDDINFRRKILEE